MINRELESVLLVMTECNIRVVDRVLIYEMWKVGNDTFSKWKRQIRNLW